MGIREAGDLPNGRTTAFKLIEDCFSDADWKLFKRKGVVELQKESLVQKTEETKMLLWLHLSAIAGDDGRSTSLQRAVGHSSREARANRIGQPRAFNSPPMDRQDAQHAQRDPAIFRAKEHPEHYESLIQVFRHRSRV